ncbi:amino acid ABC transporter membrane protein 1, PAAT family [Rhizobiales bacterium GAS188]|nr:amino acid ABC transporter membrane protein 1, PAAT family [Rhizobiales bacterium GAS188]
MNLLRIIEGIFEGFEVTAGVTALGLLFAVPFAFGCGIAQHFLRGAAGFAVTAIIEFWRSSPVIVLLFIFYYSLPVFGVTLSAFAVGAMVLGLNTGGYGSQTVRAALQSLPAGQVEGGLALGLKRWQVLLKIELPQALGAMLPTFVNQVIQLVKGTALVSLITLADMTYRAKEIAQAAYNPAGVYTSLLIAYFIICYPMTILGRVVERRVTAGRKLHDNGLRDEF